VEIVPLSVRSTTVGVFLFVMNNIGGNLPILVDPVSKVLGYRESLYIFYGGTYLISKWHFSALPCLTRPAMLVHHHLRGLDHFTVNPGSKFGVL
jgi:hypothetical protein